ncbi:SDR family oxidoreductase [Variovorax sp. RCC_210]|uniref:SDR family oxidoreductase n=1 Tax=Variovorax sp. RCC_210 TaxID=3239217 RepID=UPI0035251C40
MSIIDKPLDQQVIVITGASSGIGLCTAQLAAQQGARLVLVARSGEVLQRLAQDINEQGGHAVSAQADVADRTQIDRVALLAISHFGRIDTWVNDAGISIYGRLDKVSEADSRRLFDTNFWGVVNGSLAALPYLKLVQGKLVNVGSEVSDAVIPLQGMYSASKHAVKGFTDALRVELEDVDRSGVTVTLIQPTAVDTPYPEHARNYMDQEPKLPTPMIDPLQVAEAILKAAVSGGRDIKVGGMAVMNTVLAKVLPSVADRMSAKQVERQQKGDRERDPEGALYRAGNSGRTHGKHTKASPT